MPSDRNGAVKIPAPGWGPVLTDMIYGTGSGDLSVVVCPRMGGTDFWRRPLPLFMSGLGRDVLDVRGPSVESWVR